VALYARLGGKLSKKFSLSYRIAFFTGALSLVAGVIVSLNVSQVYAAHATVQIGYLGFKMTIDEERTIGRPLYSELQPLESQRSLGEVLRGRYRMPEASKNQLPAPYLYNIELRVDGVVNLFARGETPEQVEEFLTGVIDWIIRRHEKIFNLATRDISLFRGEIRTMIQKGKGSEGRVISTPNMENSDINTTDTLEASLAGFYRDATYSLLPFFTRQTQVVSEPIASAKPLKPKPLLYFLTSVIISLFSGLAAFSISVLVNRIRAEGFRSLWA
jgi:hypothetical protein